MRLESKGLLKQFRKFSAYSRRVESAWLSDLPDSPYPPYSRDMEFKETPRLMIVVRNVANDHLNAFNRRLRSYSIRKGGMSTHEVKLARHEPKTIVLTVFNAGISYYGSYLCGLRLRRCNRHRKSFSALCNKTWFKGRKFDKCRTKWIGPLFHYH